MGRGVPDGAADRRFAERLDVRFNRKVERFHRLGARVLVEYLAGLAARRLIRQQIETDLDEILGRLDPVTLAAAGADRMPATPIHLVPRRGR
jgi:hypothetical protein